MADVADLAHEQAAVWIARELAREPKRVTPARLRLISLWSWFSSRPGTFGHELIDRPWTPDMRIGPAREAADAWRTTMALHVNLGREPIADMWLRAARVGGYDFLPLGSIAAITEEADAMRNCLRTYGYNLTHNRSRLWSMRRDGQHVATLSVGSGYGLGVELRRKGSALTIQADGQPEYEMGHDSAGDFYPLKFGALLRPKRNTDGTYTFTWFQLGGALQAERNR